jgi:hypothetical protein
MLMRKRNQLSNRVSVATVALVLSGAVAFGGPPWKSKEPAAWTAKDIEQILTSSPWAQPAVAAFTAKEKELPQPGSLPGVAQAGLAGPRGVTDGRWDGGVGRNTSGELPRLNVSVRWDSALPVREALKKSESRAEGKPVSDNEVPQSYVITVTGLIPAGHYKGQGRLETRSSSGDSGPNSPNPEQALEGLMGSSSLRIPGKKVISPEDVKFEPETGALHLYFPRTTPIEISDKEVAFATRFGSLYVEKRFRLKEMTYKDTLEL